MYVRMIETLGTPAERLVTGEVYDLDVEQAEQLVRAGLAAPTTDPPRHIAQLLARLDDGADRPCLFLPFVGEFGHLCMTHIRLVHWHKARIKVVCCRPGEEVLYPSATSVVTDWRDPIPDAERVATIRDARPEWPDIVARYPDHHPVRAGNLDPRQELYAINGSERVPFDPRRRDLRADVVFGVRFRAFSPERNWMYWQRVADAVSDAGFTFAVIGHRATSYDLRGQYCHTGDLDTDAAVELLQTCRLYVGTDSGNSHLAAAVGAPMMIFRETAGGSRDLTPRMEQANPGRVEVIREGWDRPDAVISAVLDRLRGA